MAQKIFAAPSALKNLQFNENEPEMSLPKGYWSLVAARLRKEQDGLTREENCRTLPSPRVTQNSKQAKRG